MFWEDTTKDISPHYRPASAEYSPFTLDTDGSIRVFIVVDRVDPGLMLAILVDIRTVYGKFTYKE